MAERKRGKTMVEQKPAAVICPRCGTPMEVKSMGSGGTKYRCPKCFKKLLSEKPISRAYM